MGLGSKQTRSPPCYAGEKDFNVINEQNRALNDSGSTCMRTALFAAQPAAAMLCFVLAVSKPKQLLLDAELFGEMAEANLQQARQLANDDQVSCGYAVVTTSSGLKHHHAISRQQQQ
jgi:hypothetical protein